MIRRAVSVLLLSSLSVLSHAAGSSRIQADRMVYREQQGITVFSGHVLYTEPQQAIAIHADKITIISQAQTVVRIEAVGDPVRFSHKGSAKPIRGEAKNLLYVAARDTLTLSGGAEVQNGKDQIRGETIEYNIASRQATANNGGKPGGRFEAIIDEGSHQPGDGPAK